jgi:hypothetical protein
MPAFQPNAVVPAAFHTYCVQVSRIGLSSSPGSLIWVQYTGAVNNKTFFFSAWRFAVLHFHFITFAGEGGNVFFWC